MESQHCFADGWACKKYVQKGQHDSACATCAHSQGCHKNDEAEFRAIYDAMKKTQEDEAKKMFPQGQGVGICRRGLVLLFS